MAPGRETSQWWTASTSSGTEQNHLLNFNGHLTCSPVKRVEVGTYLAPVLNLNIDFSEIIHSNSNSEEVITSLSVMFLRGGF